MPKFRIRKRENGKQINRVYDTDKSMLVCKTPKGILYKKSHYLEYFLYNPNGKTLDEKITRDVPWNEASHLCREYGTKEMFQKLFTVLKKSTNARTGPHSYVTLDDRTRVIAMRNACKLHMNLTQYVRFLIQKYNDYH